MSQVKIVHQGAYGFVTDIGSGPTTLQAEFGYDDVVLQRYGAWKMDKSKGQMQCVLATNDMAEAVALVDGRTDE